MNISPKFLFIIGENKKLSTDIFIAVLFDIISINIIEIIKC